MLAECEVLVSLLKLTRKDSTTIKDISRESQVPVQTVCKMLKKHSDLNIFRSDGKLLTAEGEQRLRTALRAVALGADIERVCRSLTWGEFEDISILAFETNDYTVKKHFRFSWSGRRWEIDILALKEPIVAGVDCKQWRRGWMGSASRKAVEQQIERTKALVEALSSLSEKIGVRGWRHALFVPIILSLVPGRSKFYKGTPVVPILQLRDFLQRMPAHIDGITSFRVTPPRL